MDIEETTMSAPALNVRPVEKLVPRASMVRVVPCGPVAGERLVKTGGGAGVTEKTTALLVPPGVVTVMLRSPSKPFAKIVNLAVTVVRAVEVIETLLTVIPPPAWMVNGPKNS